MITNPRVLVSVRNAWVGHGGSGPDFDRAAAVLDAATCQADVRLGLGNPPYGLSRPGGGRNWHIMVAGQTMLKYNMTQHSTGSADVDIIP